MNATRGNNIGERLFVAFLGLVFLVMAVELILLVRQNRALKAEVARLEGEVAAAGSQAAPWFKTGDLVEPIELTSVEGSVERLGYDDPTSETVLLFFSPDCEACRDNIENWKRLQSSADSRRRRFVYVSTAEPEKTAEFARDHLLQGPILLSTAATLESYRVRGIPATLVVGPGGVVRQAWVGVLSEDALHALATPRP